MRLFAIIACALTAAMAASARADHFVLTDGRTIDGDVIEQDAQSITVELLTPGLTVNRRIAKSDIRSPLAQVRQGPPYVILPVIGEIGTDVTAKALRAGFDEARDAQACYVVLAIDSPGGEVGEMYHIIDLLMEESNDLRIVAYVKSAYSAAAVIAMTCPQVCMLPKASIGACVPFQITQNGPKDVEAKFRSAFEAKVRAASAHGKHADCLIRGMSELDLEIYLATENGRPTLRTSGPGKLIKSKGQILCLTADEAAECGLAQVVADIAGVGKSVTGGAWFEASHRPWNAAMAEMKQQQRDRKRQAALARYGPQIVSLERRIALLAAKAQIDQDEITALQNRYNAQLERLNSDYQQASQNARSQLNPAAATAAAAQVMQTRTQELQQKLDSIVAPLQADMEAAASAAAALRNRENLLLGSDSN